eukprot:symbB.v1.2.016160.t1/scaffold1225.1/size130771/5
MQPATPLGGEVLDASATGNVCHEWWRAPAQELLHARRAAAGECFDEQGRSGSFLVAGSRMDCQCRCTADW